MNEEFRRKVWARGIILRVIIYQGYLKSCDRIRITKGESVYRREGQGIKKKVRERTRIEKKKGEGKD